MGNYWIVPLLRSVNYIALAGINFISYSIVLTGYSVDQLQKHIL